MASDRRDSGNPIETASTGNIDLVALDDYRDAYCSKERIHTTCEGYRAGALLDRVYDEEDLGRGTKIALPLLAVWGNRGLSAEAMATKAEGLFKYGNNMPERDVTGKELPRYSVTCTIKAASLRFLNENGDGRSTDRGV